MALRLVALVSFAATYNEAVNVRSAIRYQSQRATLQTDLSVHMQVRSKAEVMAEMTMGVAYNRFRAMNHSGADKKIMSFIQRTMNNEEDADEDSADPQGYAAVEKARTMLNSMIDEANMKKELDGVRCGEFDLKQIQILRELEQDIAFVNSEASGARAEVLRAQEVIQVIEEVKLPNTRTALQQHNYRCQVDIASLKQQLAIVAADAEVMKNILAMVCADDVRTATAYLFMQMNTSLADDSEDEGANLVKCVSCGHERVWLRHNRVQPMLATLESKVARAYLEENLMDEFGQNEHKARTVFLEESEVTSHMGPLDVGGTGGTSTPQFGGPGTCNEQMTGNNGMSYVGCQGETVSGRTCQRWSLQTPHKHDLTTVGDINYCRNPEGGKETIWCYTTDPKVPWEFCEPLVALEHPGSAARVTCKDTNACKLGTANCLKLKDRFLNILAGILDKKEELSNNINFLKMQCKEIRQGYRSTITALESQLKEEQTALAIASKALTENQQQSALSNSQHMTLHGEYKKTMTECCDTRNELTAEICALEKIRGELYKLKGITMYISDCEVSDWADGECSASCGGGKQRRDRSILIHAAKGSSCPPLKMERSCSMEGCPVDCKVDDWSGWGDCTAECGGGVQSRVRSKTVEPENEGQPCPEQTESRECNVFACNADCSLADWADWSLCSKACDGGHQERSRNVVEEARGLGVCDPPWSQTRLNFQLCNNFDCRSFVQSGRTTLLCGEQIDMIIVLDGSGSLGQYGWDESKSMATKFMDTMQGGDLGVNLALMLFSGPLTANAYYACTGQTQGVEVVATDCGIEWPSHLTGDIAAVKTAAQALVWPARTTLTSYALAEAKNELINGRQDARSIVMVITDGKPLSNIRTGVASEELKKIARLVWVPVGHGVKSSIENMKNWASQPWQDNLLEISTFAILDTPATLNDMVSQVCTQLVFETTTTTTTTVE